MAKYTFRLTSEGFAELERQFKALGVAGDAAFDKVKAKMPEFADAAERATARVAAARQKLEAEANASFQNLQASLDPAVAAQQALARGETTVARARQLNVISIAEERAALDLLNREYGTARTATGDMERALLNLSGGAGYHVGQLRLLSRGMGELVENVGVARIAIGGIAAGVVAAATQTSLFGLAWQNTEKAVTHVWENLKEKWHELDREVLSNPKLLQSAGLINQNTANNLAWYQAQQDAARSPNGLGPYNLDRQEQLKTARDFAQLALDQNSVNNALLSSGPIQKLAEDRQRALDEAAKNAKDDADRFAREMRESNNKIISSFKLENIPLLSAYDALNPANPNPGLGKSNAIQEFSDAQKQAKKDWEAIDDLRDANNQKAADRLRDEMKRANLEATRASEVFWNRMFDNIFQQGKFDFKKFLEEIAIEAYARPIIVPVLQQLGSVLGIGLPPGSTAAAGAPLSGANSAPALFQWLGSIFGKGTSSAPAPAANDNLPGPVQVTPQVFGSNPGGYLTQGGGFLQKAAPYAAGAIQGYGIGQVYGSALGLSPARQENSSIGGAIGGSIGAIWGPVGSLVGSFLGSAVGGLFGPSSPSNYTATANFGAGQTSATFTGDKPNDNTTGAAHTVAQAIIAELANLKNYGVSFNDQLASISIGQRDRSSYALASGAKGQTTTVGDSGDLALQAVQALLQSSSSSSANLKGVIANNKFGSLEELDRAVQFVTQVFDVVSSGAPAATQVETAMKQLVASFKDASTQAKQLGLDVGQFAAGTKKSFDQDIRLAIVQIQDPLKYALELWQRDAQARLNAAAQLGGDIDQVKQFNALLHDQVVAQAAGNLTGGLKDLINSLRFGPQSADAPDKQYFAALQNYNQARSAAVASASPTDIQAFEQASQNFLPIARSFLGTSERYGAYTDEVTGTANSLMSRLSSPPAPDLAPLVDATRQSSDAIVDTLKSEFAGLRQEMQTTNARLDAFARRAAGGTRQG